VSTSTGFAFGNQDPTIQFSDSTALLTGNWGPNQTAKATFRLKSVAAGSTGASEELELRLRSSLSAHSCTGYEIDCSVTGNWLAVVRWNGPFGNFTSLLPENDSMSFHDGDVIKATAIGSTITVYQNGTQVLQVQDSTYASGSPGIGIDLYNASPSFHANYGFSAFSATSN